MFLRNWTLLIAGVALPAIASAGGFFLTIHDPGPNAREAIVVVEAQGCHDYSQATIAGRAEGLVDGKRQSVDLQLTAAGQPGTYAIRRQWPTGGKWVLILSGTYGDRHTNTIVELAPDGRMLPSSAPNRGIRMVMHPVAHEEIEAALLRHE